MEIIRYFFILLLLTACSDTPPVEAINARMDQIQISIEEKNTSAIMDALFDNFRGNESLDKANLRKLLTLHFLRHKNINVVVTRMDVEYDQRFPHQANMNGVVAVTGAENLLPQDGNIFGISGEWRLYDGEWYLTRLDWE